jgi:hypothetical protein
MIYKITKNKTKNKQTNKNKKTIKNEGCPEKQKYETVFGSKKPKGINSMDKN